MSLDPRVEAASSAVHKSTDDLLAILFCEFITPEAEWVKQVITAEQQIATAVLELANAIAEAPRAVRSAPISPLSPISPIQPRPQKRL